MTHDHILNTKNLDALMNGFNEEEGFLDRFSEFDVSAPSKEAAKEVQEAFSAHAALANNNDRNNQFTMSQVTDETKLESTDKVSNKMARDAMSEALADLGNLSPQTGVGDASKGFEQQV